MDRFHPIIYVRGFAMRGPEIDDTASDPFCGFNAGSTVYRAVEDRQDKPRKYVFESPVVRLMSDFGYNDVYEDGNDILDPEWDTDAAGNPTRNSLGNRSIIIHRYYDAVSSLLGDGKKPDMAEFARGLNSLIVRVRDLVVRNPANNTTEDTFRCSLVAHSMGGLVCRAFLQNYGDPAVIRHVDKLFTYATPHNGIDFGAVNVPSWLTVYSIDTFNRERMQAYLNLKDAYTRHQRVDLLPETVLRSSRVFCMVGTNRNDYEAAVGMSRTFVGHGSDGLVRIANATLCGLREDGTIGDPCAKAYAFRSHSGFFGIVNSEEAYQNLARFLFGDLRVDIWLDVEDIRLPQTLVDAEQHGRLIGGLYQIELTAAPRGKLWYLTRRIAEEDSVACFAHSDWKAGPRPASYYLSSVFLAKRAKVNASKPGLAYAMTLGIRYPDFEIDRKLWINEHYEGGYLFRNALVVEIFPPEGAGKWQVKYGWQDTGSSAPANTVSDIDQIPDGGVELTIPFDSLVIGTGGKPVPSTPGVKGRVRLLVRRWND
jgi:pimeloyl-ACP methyl ester carboxylesterase